MLLQLKLAVRCYYPHGSKYCLSRELKKRMFIILFFMCGSVVLAKYLPTGLIIASAASVCLPAAATLADSLADSVWGCMGSHRHDHL